MALLWAVWHIPDQAIRADSRVLLVAIFHASFDGAINQLSYDVVPACSTAKFLIFSAVIVLVAIAAIIATKGRLRRATEAVETHTCVSDLER